jgi:hypothetical protein
MAKQINESLFTLTKYPNDHGKRLALTYLIGKENHT